MEPKISFIPKKPIVEKTRPARPVGAFFGLALLIFFLSVAAYGGLFYYNIDMQKQVASVRATVQEEAGRIDPDGVIVRARETRERIIRIKTVLDGHIAVTPIFDLLERMTVRTVRFKDFSFSIVDPTQESSGVRAGGASSSSAGAEKEYVVTLGGTAVGYGALALQRDAFLAEKNIIKDVVVSNISLDQKGNVNFTARLSIYPEYVAYARMFPVAGAPAGVSDTESASPAGVSDANEDEGGTEIPTENF